MKLFYLFVKNFYSVGLKKEKKGFRPEDSNTHLTLCHLRPERRLLGFGDETGSTFNSSTKSEVSHERSTSSTPQTAMDPYEILTPTVGKITTYA